MPSKTPDNPKKTTYQSTPSAFAGVVINFEALKAGLPIEECITPKTADSQEPKPDISTLVEEALRNPKKPRKT